MEIQELRIRNLIDVKGDIVIVDGIRNHNYLYIQYRENPELFKFAKPIPLTEEWLLKFGFTNESRDNKFDINEWRFHVEKPFHYDGFLLCEGYSVITDRIKYVHQLQNLYYALTGEELCLRG